jgi:hypothetical protein
MVKVNAVDYDPADYLTTPEAVREYLRLRKRILRWQKTH